MSIILSRGVGRAWWGEGRAWHGVCMAGGMCGRGCPAGGHVWQGVVHGAWQGGHAWCTEKMATEVGSMHPTGMYSCFFNYRLPIKLWKGNIFSRGCLSFCPGEEEEGSHVIITYDAWDLIVQRPPGPLPSCPPHMQICDLTQNMFNLHITVQGPGTNPLPHPIRHVQTCSLRSTYVWQADGSHPSGMLSSLILLSVAGSFISPLLP